MKQQYEEQIKNLQDQVQQQDENRKKQADRDRISDQITKAESRHFVVKKGSKRYLKTIMHTVKAMVSLMLQVRRDRAMPPGTKRRDAMIKELDLAL
jgi:hypothetical protein